MELALLVWAASALPAITNTLIVCALAVSGISALAWFFTIGYPPSYWNKEEQATYIETTTSIRKLAPRLIIISIFTMVICKAIPDQKTIYMMAGAYGAQSVATSEAGKRVVKILENKLDNILKEQEESLSNGRQQTEGRKG